MTKKAPNTNLQIPFALFNGELVSARDPRVVSGKNCNCYCPKCKEPLTAFKGKKIAHHFKHRADSDCTGAYMTALHEAVTVILNKKKVLAVPPVKCEARGSDLEGKPYYELETLLEVDDTQWRIHASETEKYLGDIRPDVYAQTSKGPLALEVFVTHAVDDEKKEKLKQHNLPTLELNCQALPRELDFDVIEDHLQCLDNFKWVYYPGYDETTARLQEKIDRSIAKRNAEIQALRDQEKAHWEEQRRREQEKLTQEKRELEHKIRTAEAKLAAIPSDPLEQETYLLSNSKQTKAYGDVLKWNQADRLADLPGTINIPLPGELSFAVDRRVWQGVILEVFVKKVLKDSRRQHMTFNAPYLAKWLEDTYNLRQADYVYAFIRARKLKLSLSDRAEAISGTWYLIERYLRQLAEKEILVIEKLDGYFPAYKVNAARLNQLKLSVDKSHNKPRVFEKDDPEVAPAPYLELMIYADREAPVQNCTLALPDVKTWIENNPTVNRFKRCTCGEFFNLEENENSHPCPRCGLLYGRIYSRR